MASTATWPTQQDLHELQGDVVLGFPKRNENFLFFTIHDAAHFKQGLKQLIPAITTTAQIQAIRQQISDHKKSGKEGLLKFCGINIAFTKSGLTKLGVTDDLNDTPFNNGQLSSAEALGDDPVPGSSPFEPDWLSAFKGAIDGIVLVAGESKVSVDEGINRVEHIFGSSINKALLVDAQVRPGKEKGHEHFGFMDGISSPAIDALTGHLPGQIVVPPGVLICGEDGDVDTTTNQPVPRPAWAKNGAFLVYRHLNELVPEFNKFLADNPLNFPAIPKEQGSELLGARLFGRWKSGAPIDITPTHDDPVLAKDPQRNNNFDFGGDDQTDQTKCPFAAHIRKTNPRQDLLSKFPETALTQHMLVRQGITFGPEVTLKEAADHKTEIDRGLSFLCYQSNLTNGFEFVQKSWANNKTFPPKTINGTQYASGFDPIIGQQNGVPRQTNGLQPGNPNAETTLPLDFVHSKGGAYFFVPSISALQTKMAA